METNARFVEFCQTVATFILTLLSSLQSKNYMLHMKVLSLEHYVQLDTQITYLISLFKCNFSTAFLQFIQNDEVPEKLAELEKRHVFNRLLQKQETQGVAPMTLADISGNVFNMEANARVVKKFASKLDAQKAELEAQCAKLEQERKELQDVIYGLRMELIDLI